MFLEYFRMALETLRANLLRTALTLLGMVVGVFSVIASVTAVQVIDQYFQTSLNVLGATTFSVSRFPAIQMGPNSDFGERPAITVAQYEELKRRASLPAAVSPDEDFAMTAIGFGGERTNPNIMLRGVDEEWVTNNSFEIAQGRFLTADDVRYGRNVMVLGHPVADKLFPNESPLGKVVLADGRRYQVIGVFAPKAAILGSTQDNLVTAPISTMLTVYGGETWRNISIDVRAVNMQLLQPTIDEVTSILRVVRKVPAMDDENFEITTNDALQGPFASFTNALTLGGAAIGLIALLAAGIGIMNIMLVSVTERTREIGIRKALGARPSAILTQFLIEALVLCQVGGLLGILLGVAFANGAMAAALNLTPAIPWGWAFGAVLGVTLIALVFGLYPAFRAAALNPIEALRYE